MKSAPPPRPVPPELLGTAHHWEMIRAHWLYQAGRLNEARKAKSLAEMHFRKLHQ